MTKNTSNFEVIGLPQLGQVPYALTIVPQLANGFL